MKGILDIKIASKLAAADRLVSSPDLFGQARGAEAVDFWETALKLTAEKSLAEIRAWLQEEINAAGAEMDRLEPEVFNKAAWEPEAQRWVFFQRRSNRLYEFLELTCQAIQAAGFKEILLTTGEAIVMDRQGRQVRLDGDYNPIEGNLNVAARYREALGINF